MGHFRVFILVLLVGCGSVPIAPKVVEVPVPVECPKPAKPERPVLPITTLQAEDSPGLVIKAYAASVKALQGYAESLEELLH